MTIGAYISGNKPRLSIAFKNVAGTLTDPTGVRFVIRAPGGGETIYIYGTHAALVKDSTGNYHVDFEVIAPGTWTYRFEGSGDLIAADERKFFVLPSGA